MNRYLTRRLLQAIPTLFGITLITFLLMLATPGDPITTITFNPNSSPEATAQLRRQLGLDQPPLVQYLYWLIGNDWVNIDVDGDGDGDVQGTRLGFLRGDLGKSIQFKRPVAELLVERIPATLQLTFSAVALGYLIGIPIGLLSAAKHRSWFDQGARVLSVIGDAVPSFWLALILIIIFSVKLGVLPMSGMRDVTQINAGFRPGPNAALHGDASLGAGAGHGRLHFALHPRPGAGSAVAGLRAHGLFEGPEQPGGAVGARHPQRAHAGGNLPGTDARQPAGRRGHHRAGV
jgi:ABC-type dipeptide/oligopeptide/nickel transport systems, permease components